MNKRQDVLHRLLKSEVPLLSDGAMGTMLHAHGATFEQCFDQLNLTAPEKVAAIHQAYIDAGADIILTNTFGANPYKLADHGLQHLVGEINQAGVRLAAEVIAAAGRYVLLAGDIGPLGVRLVPYGRVSKDAAGSAFGEQTRALVKAGVDVLVIETMTDLQELLVAIRAVRQFSDVPVIASMTFTRDDRTLLGDTPSRVAKSLQKAGVDVIGVNCSGGPAQLLRIVRTIHEEAPDFPLWVKPNAGWPEQVGGRIMYPATPEYFAESVWAFVEAGVSILGGCCGTTPQHIAAMRKAIDQGPPPATIIHEHLERLPAVGETMLPNQASRLSQALAAGKFIFAVEMDPPRGLSTHRLLAGAELLAETGADVINVADSPMARMRMSPWAVCALIQDIVKVETTLHFPTRGRNLLRVQGDLLAAHALGIRNIFVVMGDPTSIGDYPDAMDNYDVVPSGLIKLIRQNFNTGVDVAGTDIGEPTSFFVGGALNLTPQDPEREMKVLRRKLKAGVNFFLTQPVFNPEAAFTFLHEYEDNYGPLPVPVLVGLLPLYGERHAHFLHNEVPGISIDEAIVEKLRKAGHQSPHVGVEIAIDLIAHMQSWVQGVYVMPAFNRYDLAADIVAAFASS